MRFKVLGGWDFFGRNSESPRYQSFLDWISFQVSTFLREEATYCLHFSVATKQIKPQGGFGCNVKQQPKGCWKGTRGEDRAEVPYTPRLVCLIMINHGDSGGNFVHVSHIYIYIYICVRLTSRLTSQCCSPCFLVGNLIGWMPPPKAIGFMKNNPWVDSRSCLFAHLESLTCGVARLPFNHRLNQSILV